MNEQEIIRLHEDKTGFLAKLRTQHTFDEELYQHVIDVIEKYIDIRGGAEEISTRVAAFLFDILIYYEDGELGSYIGNTDPFQKRVHEAQQKFWTLTWELLDVYSPRGRGNE
jgi:hypothetical protein